MSALWRIVLMRFWRSLSGILACLPQGEKGGSKAELLKISRKADRDAPCDQARMLDSVRTEVLHDAKPTNERRLALGLRLKHGCFCLPRVLQGCKTDQANNIKHPILSLQRGLSTVCPPHCLCGGCLYFYSLLSASTGSFLAA